MEPLYQRIRQILQDTHETISKAREKISGKLSDPESIEASIAALFTKRLCNYPMSVVAEGTEDASTRAKGLTVLVDPIDGTMNAAAGIPLYATSAAICKGPQVIAGFVIDHGTGNLLYAIRGEGAYCNGVKIRRQPADGNMLRVAIGRSLNVYEYTIMRDITLSTRARILGCPSLQLCYVALGRFDATVEIHEPPIIREVDITAGKLILEESGGMFRLPNFESYKIRHTGERFSFIAAADLQRLRKIYAMLRERH